MKIQTTSKLFPPAFQFTAGAEMHVQPSHITGGPNGWFDAWLVNLATGQTVADASGLTREEAIEKCWDDLNTEIYFVTH